MINPEFYLIESKIIKDDGELSLSLSNENTTLCIDGWCYPSFRENISIGIINSGSIPIELVTSNIEKENLITSNDRPIYAEIKDIPEFIDAGDFYVVSLQLNAGNLLKGEYHQFDDKDFNRLDFDIQSFIDKLKQEEEHAFTFSLQYKQVN